MREAEARLKEAALKEEHLGTELYSAQLVGCPSNLYPSIYCFLDSFMMGI